MNQNWNPSGNPRVSAVIPKEPEEASGKPKPAEFNKFATLTKKLVGVPKDELDEKLKDQS